MKLAGLLAQLAMQIGLCGQNFAAQTELILI